MSPTQTRAQTLSYLKGYLRAYALLNIFVNDCKTYTIDILLKTGDVQSAFELGPVQCQVRGVLWALPCQNHPPKNFNHKK